MTYRSFRGLALASLVCFPLSGIFPAVASPSIEVGFSPEGSAQQLVLNTIDSARQSIRLMGYSFTSPKVVKALVAAHQRGVDVKIVLDDWGNHSKASVAAMNIIVNAGIPLRTNGHFSIQHDKIFVVDSQTVESGSYNWTLSAATRNSENAMVLHDVPELAQTYLTHWQSRWDMGTDWQSSY